MAIGLGKLARRAGKAAKGLGSKENLETVGRAAGLAHTNIGRSGGYKKLAGHAGSGAIAGGLAGAGVNTLRGEDAWEGAKTGATLGAIGNAGTKGFKMAANSKGTMKEAAGKFGDNMRYRKDAIGKPMQGPATSGPVAKFNKAAASPSARSAANTGFSTGKEARSGVTKSVSALQTMAKDSAQANNMKSKGVSKHYQRIQKRNARGGR